MSDQEQKKSAIERLEDLEKKVLEFEVFKNETLQFQESVKTVVKEFQDAFNQNFEQSKQVYDGLSFSVKDVASRLADVSSLSQALGESLAALVSVMEEKSVIDTNLVSKKLLDMRAEKRIFQENNLIKQGLLKEAEVSTPDSFLVITQKNERGDVVSIREHVNLMTMDEAVKSKFVGLKAGDIVELGNSQIEVIKVLEPIVSSEESQSNG